MKLNKKELNILINLVQHEIEWTDNEAFYKEYKKQLEDLKNKLEKGE